jgi:glycogen debranching enzyme
VRTSNAGQVLFTGIASPERAAIMARTLSSTEFLTGWGIRTVSSRERRFNPTSYHNGSIWPHDNALIALGLARYGHSDLAARLTATIFDAAAHMDLRRLPELYCGMRRRRDKGPILYPVACSPQAWAAAAPFGMLQACLGLEIDATQRVARLRYPRLPGTLTSLHVQNLPIGDARVDLLLRRHGDDVSVNILKRSGDAEIVTLQK